MESYQLKEAEKNDASTMELELAAASSKQNTAREERQDLEEKVAVQEALTIKLRRDTCSARRVQLSAKSPPVSTSVGTEAARLARIGPVWPTPEI